jgi:uncharacterized protein YbjT (DUF2867 family)
MKIVVIGATGFVGRALIGALVDAGEDVRAASRRPPLQERLAVRWVHCDLAQPDTIGPALEGADVAVYRVHSLAGAADFREVDRRCARDFAAAAATTTLRRVVYLGGVAPKGEPSPHLASRLEVGEILRAGAVPTLELRASMIVGNGSTSWQILRDLAARLPFMVLPRWLESRTCPVALADVIDALLAARRMPIDASTWFDVPGPDILTMREMLEIVASLDGRRIPSLRVPVLTPALSALWLKLISGAHYAVGRELVLGLTQDLLPQRSVWTVLGQAPRWTFADAAEYALATETPPSGLAAAVERLVQLTGASRGPRTGGRPASGGRTAGRRTGTAS